jgi:hypothetical protein
LFLSFLGVNDILQTFQAVYLVQYERFRPSDVPENLTFMTVSERFMIVSERFMPVSECFMTVPERFMPVSERFMTVSELSWS